VFERYLFEFLAGEGSCTFGPCSMRSGLAEIEKELVKEFFFPVWYGSGYDIKH
jgi:hypothetical protein